MSRVDFSILMPNWNGEAWIERAVSSLLLSARAARVPFEFLVADDASDDDSPRIIAERFPRVRLLRQPVNRGFARTVNRLVRAARGHTLVIVNNDLWVPENFVPRLLRWFSQGPEANAVTPPPRLFGVSARTVGWADGKPNQLCMGAVWRGGRVTPAWSDPPGAAPCLFVQAGAAAYDRRTFLRLGGLSLLYEPGYWEDYDLSWRAARAGYAQLYDPQALAMHVGGGSMVRRYGARAVASMKMRNHLLFEWRHLQSPRLLGEYGARLPLGLLRARADGNTLFGESAMDALRRLPAVLRERMHHGLRSRRSDAEILAPFRHFTPSF